MKKIIIAAIAVFVLLIPVKAKHVYFNEDFSKEWNTPNLSEQDTKTGNIVYWEPGSTATTRIVFGYNPGSGLSNIPDREAPYGRVASSWQKLEGRQENWVTFDWEYSQSSTTVAANITVGVQARIHPDSAWTQVSEEMIRSSYNAADYVGYGNMIAQLPNELVAGKDSVQVAIYFRYTTSPTLEFFFYADNFTFTSFGDIAGQPRASVLINYPGIIATPSDIITAEITNESNVAINKVKLGYTVNNGGVKYYQTTLSDTLKVLKSASCLFEPEFANAFGENDIRVWIAALNETEFSNGEGGDTIDFSVFMPDTADAIYPTKFLVEHFTASTCNPCKDYNSVMNPHYKDLESQGKLIYVKYQMNFPGAGDPYYVAADGGVRKTYYNITAAPTFIGNGQDFTTGTNVVRGALTSLINNFSGTMSYFNVHINSAYILDKGEDDKNIYIKYRVTPKLTGELTIHTVVFEKTTTKNTGTNDETSFPHVTMKMFPNGEGKTMQWKKDSTYEFIYEHNMAETNMEESDDLELVIFIQNEQSNGIYYATQRTIDTFANETSANEVQANVLPVKIHPNPASEYVSVESPENAKIFLYNNAGTQVYTGTVKAGEAKRISLANYPVGVYVLRVISAKGVATEKIIKR